MDVSFAGVIFLKIYDFVPYKDVWAHVMLHVARMQCMSVVIRLWHWIWPMHEACLGQNNEMVAKLDFYMVEKRKVVFRFGSSMCPTAEL